MSMAEKRAGDEDRGAVAEQLRVALEQGRLELAEYDDRVARAYTAKTYGDLDELVADIPGVTPASQAQLVVPPTSKPTVARSEADEESDDEDEDDTDLRSMWTGFGILFLVLGGIWLITVLASGELHYFWPVWPLGFTAMGMSIATVTKLRDR